MNLLTTTTKNKHCCKYAIIVLLVAAVTVCVGNGWCQQPTGDPQQKAVNLFELGKQAAHQGEIKDAIRFFEQARETLADHAELEYYLGECYCREGDYVKGINALEKSYALTMDPRIMVPIKNAYFMKGLEYAKNEQYEQAKSAFTRVVEIDPNDGRALFNRGVCYMTDESYSHALQDFDSALASDFKSIELFFNRAVALDKLGRDDDAMAVYSALLEKEPLYAPAHYNLATLQEKYILQTGEYDRYARDAIYHYQRALEIDPNYYEAAFNISRIYYARGDLSMAIKWIRKSIELNGDFAEAYLHLAKLYMEKDAYNNALSQVEIMEKKGYTFPEIQQLRHEIYQITGLTTSSAGAEEPDTEKE